MEAEFTYHNDTPIGVKFALEHARHTGTRVRLFYGDPETGIVWDEDWDVTGTIGRSTGSKKIPLLISRANARGGSGILDNHILRILAFGGTETYRAPNYREPRYEISEEPSPSDDYPVRANRTDREKTQNVANFKTRQQAQRWIDFMSGRRMGK